MRSAAKSPDKGQRRGEIKEGYHSIRAGKHHIYYRIQETHIEITGALHQSMEPDLHPTGLCRLTPAYTPAVKKHGNNYHSPRYQAFCRFGYA